MILYIAKVYPLVMGDIDRYDWFLVSIIIAAVVLGLAFNGLLAYFPYALTYLFVFYVGRDRYEWMEGPGEWREYGWCAALIAASFLVTPVKWALVPGTSVFGVVNFALFLVGLTFVFFKFNRTSISVLWKPVALILFMALMNFAVSLVLSDWVEEVLGPTIASWEAGWARGMGYDVTSLNNVIIVNDRWIEISGGCTGINGIVLYGIMSAAILIHLDLKLSTKVIVVILGVYGEFAMNLLRVFLIIMVAVYSPEHIETAHHWLGNILFTLYLLLFWYAVLYLYDKRRDDNEGAEEDS